MNVIILTISGDTFYFEDNNFNTKQLNALQKIADNISSFIPEIKSMSEIEICNRFLIIAQKKLKIKLNQIKVSFVLRINK